MHPNMYEAICFYKRLSRQPQLAAGLRTAHQEEKKDKGGARIWRLRRHGVLCARRKFFELINFNRPTQCAQTVALEMLRQYAGALTVPDLQHYQR